MNTKENAMAPWARVTYDAVRHAARHAARHPQPEIREPAGRMADGGSGLGGGGQN